jgi:neutral ceramidase
MKIGIGRVVITPESPVWLAGYASRTKAGESALHDIWAKAMAIEDETGAKFVIVTADLIGFYMNQTEPIAKQVEAKHGIPRDNILFNASHTHCSPVVDNEGLHITYGLEGVEQERATAYTKHLSGLLEKVIDEALADLQPGTLHWGIGEAFFGKNRRMYTIGGVSNNYNPIGPVDNDVPTLVAKSADGTIRGILFGYACHNTVTDLQQFNGDYAGFAQIEIEKAFPGATALFAQGCGGDQNPLPRRKIELAEKYGAELGAAVSSVLNGTMTPVTGPITARYKLIPLALTEAPTEAEVDKQLEDKNKYRVRLAKKMKRQYQEDGKLPTTLPQAVQVWKFGEAVQLTALSGEVTVDYSLLIKHHYPKEKQFVMGYTNGCPAYIPSLRVLKEGGYEGAGAMIYYGVHGPLEPTVEQDIMNTIHELAKAE